MKFEWQNVGGGWNSRERWVLKTPIGKIVVQQEPAPGRDIPEPKYCATLPDGRRLVARANTPQELFPVVVCWLVAAAKKILEDAS